MHKIKAIVVDDEVANRRVIISLVQKLDPLIEIVGEAGSLADAYGLIKDLKPDLVFLDIKMPDGTGFELLEKFENIEFEIVFISGFDSYALKAFDFNALDYVLKPINPKKFETVLNKVQAKISSKNLKPEQFTEIVKSYDPRKTIISKIMIHDGNKVLLLNIENILSAKSEEQCTRFTMENNEKFLSSKELSDFSFILEQHPFMVRVSKNTFINVNYIKYYSKGSTCIITMKDETEVEVPRRKKTEILQILSGNGASETN